MDENSIILKRYPLLNYIILIPGRSTIHYRTMPPLPNPLTAWHEHISRHSLLVIHKYIPEKRIEVNVAIRFIMLLLLRRSYRKKELQARPAFKPHHSDFCPPPLGWHS
jgi:hypothetical protein